MRCRYIHQQQHRVVRTRSSSHRPYPLSHLLLHLQSTFTTGCLLLRKRLSPTTHRHLLGVMTRRRRIHRCIMWKENFGIRPGNERRLVLISPHQSHHNHLRLFQRRRVLVVGDLTHISGPAATHRRNTIQSLFATLQVDVTALRTRGHNHKNRKVEVVTRPKDRVSSQHHRHRHQEICDECNQS